VFPVRYGQTYRVDTEAMNSFRYVTAIACPASCFTNYVPSVVQRAVASSAENKVRREDSCA
jgi:hypothetical protein